MDGEGGSSEGCLKWGGGGWGSLRDPSKNILNQRGWVKANIVCRGRGVRRCYHPCPPPRKILIVHLAAQSRHIKYN